MNKVHYWLSNGLWELIKCHLVDSPPSDLLRNYLWGVAVAPHQACFASHTLSTPWQQCWMVLKLLGFSKEFQKIQEDIKITRQEVDFQFILRNYAEDESVEALFDHIRKKQVTHNIVQNDVEALLGSLLKRISKGCPSSAHCLARNLKDVLAYETDTSAEILLMLMTTTGCPPPLQRIQQLAPSPHFREICYLLFATQHGSLARSIEEEQQQQVAESLLDYLEKLVHNGVDNQLLFQNLLLTNRHFVLHLLDLLEMNPSLLELDTQHVPAFLWPLLLLRLWGNPEISELQMQNLIQQCKESTSDHVLIRVCFMLDWYLSFSRWSVSQGSRKHAALEDARNHSLLHLIYASADLTDCDWDQVRSLLHEPWDLHLLAAFSATLLLLRTMVVGAEMLRERVRLGNAAEAEIKLDEMYRTEVTTRLDNIRDLVNTITPSRFRLEVLENLFAALFITYEDLAKLSLKPSNFPSNSSQPGRGFVCTPNILRDTVILLIECAAQLESNDCSESHIELPSSIKYSQFENRLDRLSESLSETLWRLQLVVGNDFVANVNTSNYSLDRHHFQSEWFVEAAPETSKSKRRGGTEKREESGSQSPGSTAAVAGEPDRHGDRPPSPGFMNHMLASDWTLVIRCLSQGDLLNAEHIITLMSTEDTRLVLEGELNFKQAESEVRRQLLSSLKSGDSPSRSPEDASPSEPSLEAVQQVAAQAVNASALTSHIERFLSANTLPAIQGCSKVASGSMLQCTENSVAIVTLDLALTAAATHHQFRDLFSLASKHCPQLTSRVLSQMTAGKPVGYIAFAQTMMVLLHQLNSGSECSPAKFFRSRHFSFSLKTLKDQDNLWNNLVHLKREVAQNIAENGKICGDVSKAQKNVKSMQRILENLSKATESASDCLDLGRAEVGSNEMTKNVNYADLLNRYLSDLTTLALDFVPSKTEAEECVTFHTLLQQSAVEVLDRLVFHHKVDPALLEKKTQQLGFNLSASLLAGCAPAVPQGDSAVIQLQPQCIILNSGPTGERRREAELNIIRAVPSILSDLLEALKSFEDEENSCCDNYLSGKSLAKATTDASIKSILQRTEHFKLMDPVILSDDQKFAFYVNLTNLMTLHCVLSQPAEASFSSTNNLVREAAMWFIGYDIGGEFVNIGQLLSLICGDELGQSFSTGRTPVFGEAFDSDPRAIFMIPLIKRLGPGVRLGIASDEPTSKQLSLAIESFARHHITVSNGVMRIPPLLQWYLDTVLQSEEPEGTPQGSSTRLMRRLQLIIDFLMENSCSSEWLASLKAWSFTDIIVEEGQRTEFPCVVLDYCQHDHEPDAVLQVAPLSPHRFRWQKRELSESILKQLSQSWRVLIDLVVRLHDAKPKTDADVNNVEVGQEVLLDERQRSLDAQLSAWWVPSMAPLFGNNTVLAALHKAPRNAELWAFLNARVADKAWSDCWDVLRHLPDFIVLGDADLYRVRDLVLYELSNSMSLAGEAGWTIAQKIFDVNMKIKCYKMNYAVWPGDEAIKLLRDALCDEADLCSTKRNGILNSIKNIEVFTAIRDNCEDFERKSWFYVQSLSSSQPATVLEALVRSNQVAVFFDWISLDGVLASIEPCIDGPLIVILASTLPRKLMQLSACLSKDKIQKVCDEALPQLTSLTALKSVVELALKMGGEENSKYRKTRLGVEILSALDCDSQSRLVHLAQEPLLIIEQLVMNTCLDSLKLLLKKMRSLDTKGVIRESEVAELLAAYGARAVQLHVIRVVTSSRQKFFVPPITGFIVPAEVPDKEQWVPDNQVSVCMCCCMVAFSMFNRRHHCRRCGRVVCASCSANRMKVEGFKDVPVRVCQNCFTWQSKPESDKSTNIPIDWMETDNGGCTEESHYWTLSLDDGHNAAVRAEFSYQDAPSSALCLAIFNLIPESTEYTSRLLDESEKLLELLQGGDSTANPELDYPVLIQIIRALVVGAKVRYGQAGLNTGVVSCDRLLSQVDVVHLLVRSHCTRLIPPEPLNPQTMRALRNRLVEEELWDLAIELSTKAGLSLAGVWAAWGKTLLAAGCWQEARNKFSQCLVPASQHSRSSPLLGEICDIIESTTFTSAYNSHSEKMELLGSLKTLASGKTSSAADVSGNLQYEEQEWYLERYGSAASLLKFYLRKQKWGAAVEYIVLKQLEPEFFNEYVLLPAYKTNHAQSLKTAMSSNEAIFENCQRYLAAGCAYLQKGKYLSYLHDLQVFMGDYVRATMTCIQLYQHSGKTFTQLGPSAHLLQTAVRHLEQEIAAMNKKTARPEAVMRMDQKDIVRHMNTIWRQLETTKFLAACEEANPSKFGILLAKLSWTQPMVPTLFDSIPTKCVVAALTIVAGKNVEEGFGLAYRIIQDSALDIVEVMSKVGVLLGSYGLGADILKLIECINTSGMETTASTCDQVLAVSISSMAVNDKLEACKAENIDSLIALISNFDVKVKAMVDARRFKNAYLLAVKNPNKLPLIQFIMEEAERAGQTAISSICRKKLGMASETTSLSSSVPSTSSQ